MTKMMDDVNDRLTSSSITYQAMMVGWQYRYTEYLRFAVLSVDKCSEYGTGGVVCSCVL